MVRRYARGLDIVLRLLFPFDLVIFRRIFNGGGHKLSDFACLYWIGFT